MNASPAPERGPSGGAAREKIFSKMPLTDPEYGEWLKANPPYMLVMLEAVERLCHQSCPELLAEDQEKLKGFHAEFRDEISSCYVSQTYNGVIDRVNRIDPTHVLNEEDLEEVQACHEALNQLVDVALLMFEPERTRYLTHMTQTRDYVRRILAAQ